MKKVVFLITAGLLVCSLVVNWEQFRRYQSYRTDTLNQVMVDFSGPIVGLYKGFQMPTPDATKNAEVALLSRSVGALLSGLPVLDNVGIPHQYSIGILTENQFAIAALNGLYSSTQRQELGKWVEEEGALLNQYETQKSLPNVFLLQKIFKEIDDAMPISTS